MFLQDEYHFQQDIIPLVALSKSLNIGRIKILLLLRMKRMCSRVEFTISSSFGVREGVSVFNKCVAGTNFFVGYFSSFGSTNTFPHVKNEITQNTSAHII